MYLSELLIVVPLRKVAPKSFRYVAEWYGFFRLDKDRDSGSHEYVKVTIVTYTSRVTHDPQIRARIILGIES